MSIFFECGDEMLTGLDHLARERVAYQYALIHVSTR